MMALFIFPNGGDSFSLGNFEVDQSDTFLGAVDFAALQSQVEKKTTPRKYTR